MPGRLLRIMGEALPSVVLPLALLSVGLFYLFRLRAFVLFHPVRAFGAMLGKEKREAMHALSMALAGTLGVGNIAGVALAVAVGGAGAVFWMWVSAFFSMFLKYAEIVLAFLYRERGARGREKGGAMLYMRDGIGGRVGKILSFLFSILCLFCALTLGSSVQANAAAESLASLGVPPLFSGVLLMLFSALVVFGGAHSIQRITSRLIPLLTLFYLFLSLYACFRNAAALPSVFRRILEDAFSPLAAASGAGAFFSLRSVRYGVTRGLLSNEAGAGTAPMAHATAKNTPVSQGLLGMAEVFIDTFVLCSATAFAVLLAYEEPSAAEGGITLVLGAFSSLVGAWTRVPLVFSVVLFVYATVICWCFYGESALTYLTGSARARWGYLASFLCSIVVGSVFSGELVWSVTDVSLSLMTLLNLFALLCLSSRVKSETGKVFFTKGWKRHPQKATARKGEDRGEAAH